MGNNWREIWQRHTAFKLYVLLLLICFIKQGLNYAEYIDSKEYLVAANNLLIHGFPDSCLSTDTCEHWLSATRRSLGYPLLIVVFFFAIPLILLFQVLLAIYIPVLCLKSVRLLGFNDAVFKYILWFLLLYPLQFYFANSLMPELICQFLIVLLFISFLEKKYNRMGLFSGLLLLLKPVFILLIPILVLILIINKFKYLLLLLPCMVWLVISLWNKNQTGLFHYSSMGVENLWEYNQRAVLNATKKPFEIEDVYAKQSSDLSKLGYNEKADYMNENSLGSIKSHWQVYAWLHFKGALLAMVDPGRYDLVAFLNLKNEGGMMGIKENSKWNKILNQPFYILAYIVIFTLVNLLKWILVLISFFKIERKHLIIFAVIGMFIAVTGPVGTARYLFPFMPLLFIFAAHGAYTFLNFEKNTSTQR